ncbi:hypothetical protein Trydic_g21418 [Trypoxylus dichotomus]
MFPARLISLKANVKWPARSPHLRIRKGKDQRQPSSLKELKERIRQEVDAIPPQLKQRVMAIFRKRFKQCIDNDDCHLPDIIFKTH